MCRKCGHQDVREAGADPYPRTDRQAVTWGAQIALRGSNGYRVLSYVGRIIFLSGAFLLTLFLSKKYDLASKREYIMSLVAGATFLAIAGAVVWQMLNTEEV